MARLRPRRAKTPVVSPKEYAEISDDQLLGLVKAGWRVRSDSRGLRMFPS